MNDNRTIIDTLSNIQDFTARYIFVIQINKNIGLRVVYHLLDKFKVFLLYNNV